MHRATSTAARTYTANFGATSVAAKTCTPIGFITGTDIPDDSATVSDFCDTDTFGHGASGVATAGFISSPGVRPVVAAFAVAGVEAPAGDSVSWSLTESLVGAGGGNISSRGTSGGSSASNVSGAIEWADTSITTPDSTGNFDVTVTFGTSADCAAMVVRLLQIGTPTLAPTGIPSAGSVGTPTLVYNQTVSPTGISTSESLGSVTVASGQVLSPTGISTAQVMGSPTLTTGSVTVSPNGFTGGSVGSPTVTTGSVTVSPTGVGSAQSVGAPALFIGVIVMSPNGIGSAESLGVIRITVPPISLFLDGVLTDSRIGTPTVGVVRLYATPPTRQPYPVAENSMLFRRELLTQGVTWYRVGTDWFSGNDLPQDLVADELYRGGYEYPVTTTKAAELQALGFTIRTEIR